MNNKKSFEITQKSAEVIVGTKRASPRVRIGKKPHRETEGLNVKVKRRR